MMAPSPTLSRQRIHSHPPHFLDYWPQLQRVSPKKEKCPEGIESMEYQGVVILCLEALNQQEEKRQVKPLALPEWRLHL